MWKSTLPLVLLVILATNGSATEVSQASQNDDTKALLKNWFYDLALEDLIELRTESEDSMIKVVLLDPSEEYPHPSIGALLDKSHPTYPVQDHCEAAQYGGEMRMMLQLIPKELICREIPKKTNAKKASSYRYGEEMVDSYDYIHMTYDYIEDTVTSKTLTTKRITKAEEDDDDDEKGSGIVPENLDTSRSTSKEKINKEGLISIKYVAIEGLPNEGFPTESIISMTKVGVDSDETRIFIAILFPKSLWMVSMESSAEGTKYKYVDHMSWDTKTEAVKMNIVPIYMMNVLPIFQTIDNTIGSWENHILVHHKVSDDKTIDSPFQLMKTDISLIKVEKNGKFLQFFNSFQAELPPSVVQASLSFTKDKSSYVVYATKDKISGYRVEQSSQVSQLIDAKNLDTSIEIGTVVDMILVDNLSKLFLVVLEVTGDSSRIKVFPWIEESTEVYNLNEVPVFEAEDLGNDLKMKFLKGSSTDYIILIGSSPGSKTVLYEITEQGKLIHKQDFLLDQIVDVHLVQLNPTSNDYNLIFIQQTEVKVYSLDSLIWKTFDYENNFVVSTMPGSTTTFSNPETSFGLVMGKTSSPSSLLELSLRSNKGLANQNEDSMSSSQTTISIKGSEEATTLKDPNIFLQPVVTMNNSSTQNKDTTEDPTSSVTDNAHSYQKDPKEQNGSDQEKALVELIRLLKFYIFISKDETVGKNESVNGLKPLIELLNDVKDNEDLKQPDYAKSVEYVIADLEKYKDNKKLKWHPENVKKLDLVLNLVADIVNHVDRTPMTVEALIQLLKQFQLKDQFQSEREIIEYAIESLKEHNQGIKSKLESKQTDLVLLRVNFIVDGRNVESLNRNDLREILNTIKPLTKYDDRELERALELLTLISASTLNTRQKDSIRKALDEEPVDLNPIKEIVAKLEKVRDNNFAKDADPAFENSTQLNAATSDKAEEASVTEGTDDNEDDVEEYDYDSTVTELINEDEFDTDEDEEDALKDLEGYIEELGSLEAQDAERDGSEVDWCFRGNTCHTMADCQNGQFDYICRCKNGFQGDGIHCEAEDLEMTTIKPHHDDDAQAQVSTLNEQDQATINEDPKPTTREPQLDYNEVSSSQIQESTQNYQDQEAFIEDPEMITSEPHHQHDEENSSEKQVPVQQEEEESTTKHGDEEAQQEELHYLAELINNFRRDVEKMELEADSKHGEQMSTENDGDIFTQLQEETTEGGHDMISSQREGLNSLTELISTLKVYVDEMELEANSKNKKRMDELVLSQAQKEELQSLTELINRLRIYVEKKELQAASKDKEQMTTESYQTSTVEALIGNDQILTFNSTEKHYGLWPLIKHLRALYLHKVFQNSLYAENVEKLIDNLKLADARLSNASSSWDAKNLDTILNQERELIMGNKTDEIVIQKDVSSEKNIVKHMQEESDESSESLQEESDKGKLQWLIESFNSSSLVALPYKSSILFKINEANEMKHVDVKLLKEILSDLENAKWTLLGVLPGQRNSPVLEDFCSRSNNCHEKADCQNGDAGFTCHCKNGFQGNGTYCDANDDISEPATTEFQTGSSAESSVKSTEDDNEDAESATTELETDSSTENTVKSTDSDIEGSETSTAELQTDSSTEDSVSSTEGDIQVDWCSQENDCHEMANCQNHKDHYTCHCKDGFQGNGTHCDKCDQIGDTTVFNCSLINKQCVYTLENYFCSCVAGFLLDATSNSCVIPPSPNSAHESEDWCSRGNNCHLKADCKNTKSNYTCHCKNGYQGNGTHCDAIDQVLELTTSESEGDIEVFVKPFFADEVTAANLAANDTATNDTGMSGLREMIYDWREKFYIILAFFLLFTILFLIIIVVLIYKVNKGKDAYQSVVNISQ